jgi:hypothetical protein
MRTGPKSKWSKAPNAAACHKGVRDVAVGMAHEAFAALMQRNDWWAKMKELYPELTSTQIENYWVNQHWPTFIDPARATMAAMLRGPQNEGLKDSIAEVLILDGTLRRGRKSGARIMGASK